MASLISFLVTYRDRKPVLEGFIKSIGLLYPSAEIVIAEQKNDKPFMQGQLFNLAYMQSHGDVVVLMDVDVRFKKYVDVIRHMEDLQHPFIAYDKILNCTLNGGILGERPGIKGCFGGCCVLTRKQFEDANGYSNLIIGWGGDDFILNERVGGFKRIRNIVLHVIHHRMKCESDYGRNAMICETEKTRRKELDGLRQTIGNLVDVEMEGNVKGLSFDRIGVPSDFAYRDMLEGCSL